MSGHSKWSQIKRQKGVSDVRRGQLFTKLARELVVATREGGGGDPGKNVRLRLVVQKARESNMPHDNIDRAIRRGIGSEGTGQERLEETTYEGYGPGGAAILLQALTDNRNRTAAEVRHVFARSGGSLGEVGCVAWTFEQKGVITLSVGDLPLEEMALEAIEAGAEDFRQDESSIEIYASVENVEEVRRALEQRRLTVESVEVSMIPKATASLDLRAAEGTLRLVDRLEELDDVHRVYTNANFPDELLERYKSE